jgi:hypothetical protein
MTEEQSGHDKSLSKTKNIETDQNTRQAAEERAGKAMTERSALPKTGLGEKPDAGYWDQTNPKDSSDMSMDKSRFGVFEKEGGTGASVAKQGTDFKKDVRPMNQSGIYAEKDAQTWKDMAKSGEGKDAEWCGTPADEWRVATRRDRATDGGHRRPIGPIRSRCSRRRRHHESPSSSPSDTGADGGFAVRVLPRRRRDHGG